MALTYLCYGLFAILSLLMYYSSIKPALDAPVKGKQSMATLLLLFGIAGFLRIVIALSIPGYLADMNCFRSWSLYAFHDGLNNFYNPETFTDYPPGYVYVLYIIGAIDSITHISSNPDLYGFILKLVPMAFDILTGLFIYRLLHDKINYKVAASLTFLYLFNPAILVNAAAWGQVDSVLTFFVVLSVYYAVQKKPILAGLFFTIGMLIKPQMSIFAPIMLFMFYEVLFKSEDRKAALIEFAKMAGLCIAVVFLVALPFTKNFDFTPVITQYIDTLKSYPYATINAFNLFALLGGNWVDINQRFLFMTYGAWGNMFIVGIVAFSVYLYWRKQETRNFFFIAAVIIISMFTLSAKMHERYIFPVFALLLCAFAYNRDKRYNLLFILLSLTQFLNTATVLAQDYIANYGDVNQSVQGVLIPQGVLIFGSFCSVAIFIWMVKVALNPVKEEPETKTAKAKQAALKKQEPVKASFLQKSDTDFHITRADYLIMAAVTLIYAVVAFVNLGDRKAPETFHLFNRNQSFTVTFAEPVQMDSIQYFLGPKEDVNLKIETDSGNAAEQPTSEEQKLGYVYAWNKIELPQTVQSIKITCVSEKMYLNEIAFRNTDGNLVMPQSVVSDRGESLTALTDEQDTVPLVSSYKNSTYFDEIYHARTAYEYLHGIYPYENTHPPLGKIIISIGIMIFGMNPFGWRVAGTVFGILMLPCIYLFAKRIFKRSDIAFCAILLFATDFMHFAQTRISTIDVYVTFFIILMYYFMYKYVSMNFYNTPFKKKLVPLGLSGLFMGLGIASKWTGIYAGVGLAVLFFISLMRRYAEFVQVKSDKKASKEDLAAVAPFKKYATLTLLWCIPFFVIVPAVIYCLSYIPFIRADDSGLGWLHTILQSQNTMYSYHSSIKDTHPYSSLWWQWPIMTKPIWYYSQTISDNLKAGISSFGNPALWWGGIVAFFATIYVSIKKRDWRGGLLIISYLAQYLPWMGVTRILFIYHYFTCVPFVVLMVCYVLDYATAAHPWYEKTTKSYIANGYVAAYLLLAVMLFIMFYPVLSGLPTNPDYVSKFLRWFSGWVLI